MVTRIWKVEAEKGHRLALAFGRTETFNWTNGKGWRIVTILREDVTGSQDHIFMVITRDTAEECEDEMFGQLSDGFLENCRYGVVTEVTGEKRNGEYPEREGEVV
jgi:hypothetical protein